MIKNSCFFSGNIVLYISREHVQHGAWELSSVGRASALQAEGHRFEPYSSHHFYPLVRHHSQVVRQRPAKPLPPVRVWVVPPIKRQRGSPVVFSLSPEWWNGRHKGLKILRGQLRIGSSPIFGTTKKGLICLPDK